MVASSSLGLHNELPIQSNVPIVNVVYLSLPVLQGHGHQSQLAASQFLPVLQGHGQQSQQVASKVPHRFHGVSDDMLQHSRVSLSHLQSKGYHSNSNVVAGFVQDKESEFESLRRIL